ncbi:PAS domain-containing protein, partial [Sedimenticola selenatireducens]|uniref:PAS domain-containing protein n=1 Tax=Sedimenticola selenatireducens TaxID=191960 RepID=UPI003F4AC7D7
MTVQQQFHTRLDESRALMRTLIETLPDLVWLKDLQGTYLICNQRVARLFGTDESEIVGKTDHDLVAREQADFFSQQDRLAIESGGPRVYEEWVTYANDGHQELLETIKTPMYDNTGSLVGVLGIGRDITDRKRDETELRQFKKRLTEVQRLSSSGNWELDLTSDTLWWSDGVYRIFEVDAATFQPSYASFEAAIHPDDREAVGHAYHQSVKRREPYDIVHRLLLPDGRIKYVHEYCDTVYAEDGRPLRSLGMIQDVTTQ